MNHARPTVTARVGSARAAKSMCALFFVLPRYSPAVASGPAVPGAINRNRVFRKHGLKLAKEKGCACARRVVDCEDGSVGRRQGFPAQKGPSPTSARSAVGGEKSRFRQRPPGPAYVPTTGRGHVAPNRVEGGTAAAGFKRKNVRSRPVAGTSRYQTRYHVD